MKRVLWVLPVIEPSWATNQARLLLPHLLAAGYDVHVCMLSARAEPGPGQQVPCTSIAGRGPLDPVVWFQLRRTIRRLAPQLVHAWLPTHEPRLRLLPLVDRQRPWLVSQSGFRPAGSWLQSHAERHHLSSTVTWTVAHPAADAQALAEGVKRANVHRIASGVEPVAGPKPSRGAWLESLCLPPEARVVGAIGRLQTPGGGKT